MKNGWWWWWWCVCVCVCVWECIFTAIQGIFEFSRLEIQGPLHYRVGETGSDPVMVLKNTFNDPPLVINFKCQVFAIFCKVSLNLTMYVCVPSVWECRKSVRKVFEPFPCHLDKKWGCTGYTGSHYLFIINKYYQLYRVKPHLFHIKYYIINSSTFFQQLKVCKQRPYVPYTIQGPNFKYPLF